MIHEATLNTGSVIHNLISERLLFSVTFRNAVRDFTVWKEQAQTRKRYLDGGLGQSKYSEEMTP
jgi:hypothetical protein